MSKWWWTIGIATVAVLVFISYAPERTILNDVKSGASVLECNNVVINPVRVVDYVDGRWYFDNGSMVNCHVRN